MNDLQREINGGLRLAAAAISIAFLVGGVVIGWLLRTLMNHWR